MLEFKTLKEIKPTNTILKIINSSNPIIIDISNGKFFLLKPTNIESIILLKYKLYFDNGIIEIYEYPKDEINGYNFYNLNNKEIHEDYKDTILEFLNTEGVIVESLILDRIFIDELIFIP